MAPPPKPKRAPVSAPTQAPAAATKDWEERCIRMIALHTGASHDAARKALVAAHYDSTSAICALFAKRLQ